MRDDDLVYRRVPSRSLTIDHKTGRRRPTSDCFSDSTRPEPSPMSCILGSLLEGRSPGSLVPGPGGDALVCFRAGDLLALGLSIERAPTDDEPAHVHVVGKKSRSVRAALADIAELVDLADQPDGEPS